MPGVGIEHRIAQWRLRRARPTSHEAESPPAVPIRILGESAARSRTHASFGLHQHRAWPSPPGERTSPVRLARCCSGGRDHDLRDAHRSSVRVNCALLESKNDGRRRHWAWLLADFLVDDFRRQQGAKVLRMSRR